MAGFFFYGGSDATQEEKGEEIMPAQSKKQRKLMGLAEHHPEKLYERNKGVAKMTKKQLHEYASTKEKGLPKKKK